MRTERRQRLFVAMACVLVFSSAIAGAKDKKKDKSQVATVDQQIDFGVKMAERGLWSEALFRFRQADQARPDDHRILNNLAVAYEAVGGYDQALESYQKALRVSPNNSDLRRNYSRFVEFYQAFKPGGEPSENAAAETADAEAPLRSDAEAEKDEGIDSEAEADEEGRPSGES